MRKRRSCTTPLLAMIAIGILSTAPSALAADWEWSLTPYIWGAGVELDIEANDEPVLNTDVSFSDILDKTEMTGMLHFEGRTGEWGFLFDVLYLNLGAEQTTSPDPPLPGGTELDSDLKLWIAEGAAAWRPMGESRAFDIIFGLRMLDVGLEVDADVPAPINAQTTIESSKSFLDGFVGARYMHPFAKRWDFALRGDVGTGDTELTWNAMATMGVRFDEAGKYSLRFGYRHLDMDFENDDNDVEIDSEIVLSGAIVGFMFRW